METAEARAHLPEVLKILTGGQPFTLPVAGTSMLPWLRPGDEVSLQLAAAEALKIGDVMVFRLCQQLVMHRLIGKKRRHGQWLLCEKGDNLRTCSWINEEQVLGKITAVRRGDSLWRLDSGRWLYLNPLLAVWARIKLHSYAMARALYHFACNFWRKHGK